MSDNLLQFTRSALLGDLNTLWASSRMARYKSLNPINYAIPALLAISGNPNEIASYQPGSDKAFRLARLAFKTVLINTAFEILKHHPELGIKVLNTEWLKKKLYKGPFKRMPYTEKATKVLSLLLIDPDRVIDYQVKGHFDWDNGDYQAAIVIAYGWRKTLNRKLKLFLNLQQAHLRSRIILRTALKKHPDNTILQFVEKRYKLSWYLLNNDQKKELVKYFKGMETGEISAASPQVYKLLGISSKIDLGLRYRQPKLILDSVDKIQRLIVPHEPNHPSILSAKAWANVYLEKKKEAKKLALKIAESDIENYKIQAINILQNLGENKKADLLLKRNPNKD